MLEKTHLKWKLFTRTMCAIFNGNVDNEMGLLTKTKTSMMKRMWGTKIIHKVRFECWVLMKQ